MLAFILFLGMTATSATAVFFYLRSRKFYVRLIEGGRLFDEQSNDLKLYKAQLAAYESSNKRLISDLDASRKAQQEATTKLATTTGEFLLKQTTLERKLANAELQRDHILTRFEALEANQENLEAQARANQEDATAARRESETTRREAANERQNATLALKQENGDLRRKINDLERQVAQLKNRTEVDPKVLETARRRATHNEQLYQSMRSLRDLADERNRNWEQALRLMATWILSKSQVATPHDPIVNESIGPLVGEALQRIGASLIDSDEASERAAEKLAMNAADQSAADQSSSPRPDHLS